MFSKSVYSSLIAFLLLTSLSSCTTQDLGYIRGNIARAEGWKSRVYLVKPRSFAEIASNYGGMILDSAQIAANGCFEFSNLKALNGTELLELCVQRQGARFNNQLYDTDPSEANYMAFVWQKGETIEIQASTAQFQQSFAVKNPSRENTALLHLRDLRQESWAAHKTRLLQAPDEHTLLEHEAALQSFRQPMMAFADSATAFWATLLSARWVSPEGDYERVPEFMVGACTKWQAKQPENAWVKQLCAAANPEKLPLLVGSQLPDHPLPMEKGDTLMLSQLLGERLTILDLWASWCAPCRRENKDVLLPLWQQFNDKGLNIVGYSIDSSPSAWKAAVQKDQALWPQASHLSGDSTPFMDMLRLTTIPANYILDASGKIIAKNLHGDALKNFIATQLK